MKATAQPRIHYLEQWREHRELSRQELGDKVGMTRQNIQKIEQFDRPMTQAQAPSFARALGVEVWQLFRAPDAALPDYSVGLPLQKKRNRIDAKHPEDDDFPAGLARVEEIDIRAGLGGGGEVDAVNTVAGANVVISKDAVKSIWGLPDQYLGELGLPREGIFLFRVLGDSMTKSDGSGVLSGDIMLADTNDRRPSPPGIFAISDGLGTVVKRVEYVMNSAPALINVISDNPAHATVQFPMEDVRIIGRCVWFGRRM